MKLRKAAVRRRRVFLGAWGERFARSFAVAILLTVAAGPTAAAGSVEVRAPIHPQDSPSACGAGPALGDLGALPPEATSSAVARWLAVLPACERDAAFLLRLGRALNALGRFEESAEHLERALLLQPQVAEARQAFAIALLGLGDLAAARELLADVWQAAEAPAAVRNVAREQWRQVGELMRQSLAEPPPPGWKGGEPDRARTSAVGTWQHGGTVALFTGAESNLLGAPGIDSLTLTLPGIDSTPVLVTVPLDSANRARGGGYVQAQAGWQGLRRAEHLSAEDADRAGLRVASAWSGAAAVRHREVPALPSAGYTQADAALEYTRTVRREAAAATPTGLYAAAAASLLDSRTGVRFQALGIGAGFTAGAPTQDVLPWGCEWRWGVDGQRRRYLSNPALDGTYTGGQIVLGCRGDTRAPWHGHAAQWQLRAGRDSPTDPGRPGARQAAWGMRATWQAPRWVVDIDWAHTLDATGYSPLIEQGARREQQRLALRVERRWALSSLTAPSRFVLPGMELVAGLEGLRQRSNLPLFRINNFGLFMGVKTTN